MLPLNTTSIPNLSGLKISVKST